jgi:hypothetical protein
VTGCTKGDLGLQHADHPFQRSSAAVTRRHPVVVRDQSAGACSIERSLVGVSSHFATFSYLGRR